MDAQAQLGAIERLIMPGPVTQSHADIEQDCGSCHVRFERDSQNTLCLDCHQDIAEDLATSTGFHSLSPDVAGASCASCHTDHEGRNSDIVGLDTAGFDHELTDFVLRGSHLEAECEGCHLPELTYHDAETDCVACHREDDQHLGNLGATCADCHVETQWAEASFDHLAMTSYALTGGHAGLACITCHVDEMYDNMSTECVSCHRDDDTHDGSNGNECQSCHVTDDWQRLLFDHFTSTGFALSGGHANLTCESCHQGNKFEQATPTDCIGCHRDDDAHDGINGDVCGDCHGISAWLDISFDHERDAEFALLGAHAGITCASCHVEPVATALPGNACYDCHVDDDPHEMQLGETCADCHNQEAFAEHVRFDHDLTSFPLLGRHDEAVCEDCHASRAFLDAPETCADCHAEDDAHDGRLGEDCALCHNPNDWFLWAFDHDVQTGFVLEGAHEGLDCLACHRQSAPVVVALPTACGSCHRSDDVHAGAFGDDCEQCHTSTSFAALRSER